MKLHHHLLGLILLLAAGAPLRAAEKQPSPACDRVRFECKSASKNDFVGAKVEGSNVSRTEGFVTLAEVKDAPDGPGWGEMKFENARVFRWLRFSLPASAPAKAKLAGVEFLAGERLLGSSKKSGYFHVFDANGMQSDRAIGADLFDSAAAPRVVFKPASTDLDAPADVTMHSAPGAVIRFTRDGSWPTAEHGETYSTPIHIENNTTLSAVAIVPERGPGELTTGTWLMRGSTKPGLSTAHLGNSLTGTTKGFASYARTAGYEHHAVYFLHGGALTRELWALTADPFEFAPENFKGRSAESVAHMRAQNPWQAFWLTVGKVDLLTLQPRDFDLDKELAAEIAFIKLFRQKSPDMQPWLYCEWVEQKRLRPSDRGETPSFQMQKTFPALTWEESMGAMLLYVEELQHRLVAQFHEGKRPRILPSALAMGWIKNMIDHGRFPGAKAGDFYPLLFHDQAHPANGLNHDNANGAYVVDTTWFSAFYGEAPEGKVLPIETTFTPEQARAIERLAWDVIKNYPDCGLYEEGTQPCGKPEFSNDGKTITLASATPGAWFRYTLDGTEPTRTRGYVYCGAISVQPGIHVKAVAYKSGMADSATAEPDR
jgi:hypothetical protein